ncbi:MAG: type II toxin-antitoxin system Phd/YefM family antitoxin [Candidatus Accumulibacter sp.]|nr:type II toxin-antitoxin system Phd/YefM family antitoxin [Accumulibacter sp.]
MEHMAVADFKANFSAVIDKVREGSEIEILYGRAKTPVARLVPVASPAAGGGLLGCLRSARFTMSEDWELSDAELIES